MILLTAGPMPFNAMVAFAVILGIGSLIISAHDAIKKWRK